MKLLPIEYSLDVHANLTRLFPIWYSFLPKIAQRSKETVSELTAKIRSGQVQPILIWDEEARKAVALIGISYHMRGTDKIAEWVWMAGHGRKDWEGLLPDLERYLTEHVGCAELRPVCRPGWWRLLKKHGYRITHYTLEKDLRHGK